MKRKAGEDLLTEDSSSVPKRTFMTRVKVNFNREIFPFWLAPELRFK